MLIIHPESHLDHDLTTGQLVYVLKNFSDKAEFFIETIVLPEDLGRVPCALYGPLNGDDPVHDVDVYYAKRGDRKGNSRMTHKPVRQTRQLTVIAGPHDGFDCVLLTAYGGPSGAPKEPWDCAEGEERKHSEAFWREHALAQE